MYLVGQAEVLPDETQLVDMGHDDRVGLFRALLVRLHTMRKEIIDKPGAEVVVAEDTEERAERIARKAERLRQEKGIRVDVEKTHVGVSGEPTHVIVVTIVVLARLTAPFRLRSPKKSKPRRKNGNPEKNQAVSSLVAGIARGSQ